MKLLIIQKDINDTDWESHLSQSDLTGVDLVCFGELAVSGCLYEGGEGVELESILKRLAAFDPAVMLGFPRRTDQGLCNSYLYHKAGSFTLCDKLNLFEPMNEPLVYQPGSELGLFDTEFGTLGVAICFDLRFPEIFQRLRKAGARRIFVPAAFPLARINDWKRLLVERAIEFDLWMIGINAIGDDGRNVFGGNSMVAAPSGRVVARAAESKPRTLTVEL